MAKPAIQKAAAAGIKEFVMFHKIKNVAPLPDMCLIIDFIEGGTKRYDMKPLIEKFDVFKDLKQNGLFDMVRLDIGGYGIVWNEYIDLACNELWENGERLP